ncbi:hypothetical protein SFUMM280S_06581 [Streptomyces fumanus]
MSPSMSRTRRGRSLTTVAGAVALVVAFPATAFAAPPPALPANAEAAGSLTYQPAFDYDTDGCYPTPAISADGTVNAGLNPTGALTVLQMDAELPLAAVLGGHPDPEVRRGPSAASSRPRGGSARSTRWTRTRQSGVIVVLLPQSPTTFGSAPVHLSTSWSCFLSVCSVHCQMRGMGRGQGVRPFCSVIKRCAGTIPRRPPAGPGRGVPHITFRAGTEPPAPLRGPYVLLYG